MVTTLKKSTPANPLTFNRRVDINQTVVRIERADGWRTYNRAEMSAASWARAHWVMMQQPQVISEGSVSTSYFGYGQATRKNSSNAAAPYIPYGETYSGLRVHTRAPETPFNYRYIVTNQATSHTAFVSREHFERWARVLDLALESALDKDGEYNGRLYGTYYTASWLDEQGFYELRGEFYPVLSNGDYTVGIVTTNEQGRKVMNYLNPNVRTRPLIPYQLARSIVG